MNRLNEKRQNISITLSQFIVLTYSVFGLLFCYLNYNNDGNIGELLFQIITIVLFVTFFYLGQFYSAKAFCLFVFLYQILLSGSLNLFFWNHQYLLDNNLDWKTYVKWASFAQKTDGFFEFIKILNENVFEFADLGYPVFLYHCFNITDNVSTALLLAAFSKCVLFTISTFYFYRICCHFMSRENSKQAFLLYSLNSASIFFNAVNLKESVFVSLCVFTVYNLVVFRDKKTVLSFIGFHFFLFTTALFRIYVSFFIWAAFIASTLFRKFVKNYFYFIWICVGCLGAVAFMVLKNYLGLIAYVLSQSVGGNAGFSMPVLIITGFLFPVPALVQSRTPDNFLVCAYSIFSIVLSIFAVYEIFLIFKRKQENMYTMLFLVFFIKLFVIMAARVNEYRFQFPLVFTYFVFMIEGFNAVLNYGIKIPLTRKRLRYDIIFILSVFIGIAVTFLYNQQGGQI